MHENDKYLLQFSVYDKMIFQKKIVTGNGLVPHNPLPYHKRFQGQLMSIFLDKGYSVLNDHLLPIWHQAIFHTNTDSASLI